MELISDAQAQVLALRKQEDTIIHHKLSSPHACEEAYKWLIRASRQRNDILQQCIQQIRGQISIIEHDINSMQHEKFTLDREQNWLQSQLDVENIIHANSMKIWKEKCGMKMVKISTGKESLQNLFKN